MTSEREPAPAYRDEEAGAALQARALEDELRGLVARLVARARVRRDRGIVDAFVAMAVAASYLFLVDDLRKAFGPEPSGYAAPLVAALASAAILLALLGPAALPPRLRAARVRRRYLPPPRSLRSVERAAQLAAAVARARQEIHPFLAPEP